MIDKLILICMLFYSNGNEKKNFFFGIFNSIIKWVLYSKKYFIEVINIFK